VSGSASPRLGASPKDVVWQRGRRSCGATGRRGQVRQPLLIVFSLVSRSYILDLRPGHSAVEFLVDRGFDVFMLDWARPTSGTPTTRSRRT
jgi:polyhydroxyalkanoate synthase